jgi:hypothetical protein
LPLLLLVGVAVALPVPVEELLRVLLALPVVLPVPLLEGEVLGLAPRDREAVADALTVELTLRVVEGVAPALPVPLLLPDCVGEGDSVTGGVALPEREMEALKEGLAAKDREAVGELLKEALRLRVLEGVEAPVPLPLCVGVPEGEAVPEEEAELLSVPLLLPLLDALAPGDSGGVPLALTVLLPLWVVEGVPLAVGLLLPVPLTVEEGEDVSGGEALPLRELLPEFEAEAPAVSEAVGDLDTVEEPESVEEGVGCAVPLPELEELLVGVGEEV